MIFRGAAHRLVLLRDSTGAKERQQQLEAFAGAVAHDLKNPLAGLALWIESAQLSLREGELDESLAELAQAQAAAGALRALIDDYLAHAVSRHGALRPVVTAPAAVLAEAAAPYPQLTLEMAADEAVLAGPTLLRQLFRNVLDNAVKYARPDTTPWVQVTAVPAADPAWVEIRCADRGIGLQPGDEERIFSSYTRGSGESGGSSGGGGRAGRLDGAGTDGDGGVRGGGDGKRRRGIGLGLALCKSVVERHGGTIRAEGNAWGGTTFRFTLPSAGLSALSMSAKGDGRVAPAGLAEAGRA